MAKDPVCGMFVEEKPDALRYTVDRKQYFFCAKSCLDEFTAPERELKKLKRKVAISIVLTIPLTILTYVIIFPKEINNYILLGLATPIQFWIGWRFYVGLRDSIKAKASNMDALIAIGTSAAYFYSAILTMIPGSFPFEGVYFETAAIIITLILLGRLLEARTKEKASQAVRKLLDLQPRLARVIKEVGGTEERKQEEEVEVPIEEVQEGELLIIRPGELVPTDGKVIEGFSSIDESAITGESIPVDKALGQEVIGATINKSGLLKVKATKVGKDTVLSQIITLVEEAKTGKAPMQKIADQVAKYFVPSIIIIALAANGILFKGGEYLEIARKINTVVFDKTGTLTKGKPEVTDIIAISNTIGGQELLRLSALAESGSEHPLGQAVVRKAQEEGMIVRNPDSFEAISGQGLRAGYGDHSILIGNRKLMEENNIQIVEAVDSKLKKLEIEGKTATLVSIDNSLSGIIAIADTIKESAKDTIDSLKSMGIEVVMLTGDNERTASAIASKLGGIDRVIAEVLPQEKEDVISKLKSQMFERDEGKNEKVVVAMVGDGINDAPALATADLGIAIGSGTDVAKETGGIILIKDDLRDIVVALAIGKKTVSKIRQNLFWAFAYNTGLIPIAAGALVPFFGAVVYAWLPFLAAGAMAMSSVTVVGNSLLLGRYKPKFAVKKTTEQSKGYSNKEFKESYSPTTTTTKRAASPAKQ